MPLKSKRKNLVWDTTDFFGNYITLEQVTWNEHIVVEHPAMASYEALTKSVVENPDEIRLSTQQQTALAFISGPGTGPGPEGIRALVNYTDNSYEKGSSFGRIVTAYPVDIIKYGTPKLGKLIYKRGGGK